MSSCYYWHILMAERWNYLWRPGPAVRLLGALLYRLIFAQLEGNIFSLFQLPQVMMGSNLYRIANLEEEHEDVIDQIRKAYRIEIHSFARSCNEQKRRALPLSNISSFH